MEQGHSPVTERLTMSEEFLCEAVAERQAVLTAPRSGEEATPPHHPRSKTLDIGAKA